MALSIFCRCVPGWGLLAATNFRCAFLRFWAATLALPVLWQVARRLVNGNQSGVVQSGVVQSGVGQGNQTANTIALVTVLLLASNPYQLWYSQEGRCLCHHHLFVVVGNALLAAQCRPWWLAQLAGLSHHRQPGDLLPSVDDFAHPLAHAVVRDRLATGKTSVEGLSVGDCRVNAALSANALVAMGSADGAGQAHRLQLHPTA